jgi:ribonuclease HI
MSGCPARTAYTDGSSCRLDNWQAGGWAVVIVQDGHITKEASGTIFDDDASEGEWIAILKAVELLGEAGGLVVSDSSGSVRRAEKLFPSRSFEWRRRGSTSFNARADELARLACRPAALSSTR